MPPVIAWGSRKRARIENEQGSDCAQVSEMKLELKKIKRDVDTFIMELQKEMKKTKLELGGQKEEIEKMKSMLKKEETKKLEREGDKDEMIKVTEELEDEKKKSKKMEVELKALKFAVVENAPRQGFKFMTLLGRCLSRAW